MCPYPTNVGKGQFWEVVARLCKLGAHDIFGCGFVHYINWYSLVLVEHWDVGFGGSVVAPSTLSARI